MEYKLMYLYQPYLVAYPVGVYTVQITKDSHINDCYYIDGVAHNKFRFIEVSSLLLELI